MDKNQQELLHLLKRQRTQAMHVNDLIEAVVADGMGEFDAREALLSLAVSDEILINAHRIAYIPRRA